MPCTFYNAALPEPYIISYVKKFGVAVETRMESFPCSFYCLGCSQLGLAVETRGDYTVHGHDKKVVTSLKSLKFWDYKKQ